MSRYFSAATGGFYDDAIHGSLVVAAPQTKREIAAGKRPKMVANPATAIPLGAIPLTDKHYALLMENVGRGHAITVANGKPVADKPPVQDEAEQRNIVRRQRSALLVETDALVSVPDTPLTAEEQAELIDYRQKLRDITKTMDPHNPVESVNFPTKPTFLEQ